MLRDVNAEYLKPFLIRDYKMIFPSVNLPSVIINPIKINFTNVLFCYTVVQLILESQD